MKLILLNLVLLLSFCCHTFFSYVLLFSDPYSPIDDLNLQVETAKATIHEEVQAVQESMEEFFAFTDKKFASQNDFVRYQLAGK